MSSLSLKAQQIEALVLSEADSSGISGVHIRNMAKEKLAISNKTGAFTLAVSIGDTLILSNINYNSKAVVYTKVAEQTVIFLKPNTIQLEEVIVSNMPQTTEAFKSKVLGMDMQPAQEFLPYGMTKPKAKGKIPHNYNPAVSNSFKYAINKPISFIVKKLSKRHKAKVKYYETIAQKSDGIAIDKKYNRVIVKELTQLEGDVLTRFITFMDVDPGFLSRATEYEIATHIKSQLTLFQQLERKKMEENTAGNDG